MSDAATGPQLLGSGSSKLSDEEIKKVQEKNDKNHTQILFLNHEIDGYKSQISKLQKKLEDSEDQEAQACHFRHAKILHRPIIARIC